VLADSLDNAKPESKPLCLLLYLLHKHANDLLPGEASARQQEIQQLMFANATVHPAYSKLMAAAEQDADLPAVAALLGHYFDGLHRADTALRTRRLRRAPAAGSGGCIGAITHRAPTMFTVVSLSIFFPASLTAMLTGVERHNAAF
jgi:hypothetical protein